jgi:ATP-dependent Clp protease adapter protein ClpS
MSERAESSTQQPTPVQPQPASHQETAVRPSLRPGRMDRLPLFRVLLHNDDVNDILDVVEAICDLTPLNARRAAAVTLEAHNQGVALLLTTHRERAELYVEQFHSKRLTVTIEPAE